MLGFSRVTSFENESILSKGICEGVYMVGAVLSSSGPQHTGEAENLFSAQEQRPRQSYPCWEAGATFPSSSCGILLLPCLLRTWPSEFYLDC